MRKRKIRPHVRRALGRATGWGEVECGQRAEKAARKMAQFDRLSPELRALANEYGFNKVWALVCEGARLEDIRKEIRH